MKELQYLIYDVREQTDNRDENGVKDREFVRYFNDGVRTIQTMIFKNNPLCSYYQSSVTYQPQTTRIYDLPSDVFGDNAVSMVEVSKDGGTQWTPLDRVWPEEGGCLVGWFTRNKQVVIAGPENYRFDGQVRVWYFNRLPRFDKAWAKVNAIPVGQLITMNSVDLEMFRVDRFVTILKPDLSIRVSSLPYTKTSDTSITVVGNITSVAAGDFIVMGKGSLMTLDMPDECESYLMDYVGQRIAGRQSYGEDWNKFNYWTSEERANIMSIFADASQAEVRAPITDTEYLRV